MVHISCLSQYDQLAPPKHIFGESASAWLGSIENQQWVNGDQQCLNGTIHPLKVDKETDPTIAVAAHGQLPVNPGWIGNRRLVRLLVDTFMPSDNRIGGAFHLTGGYHLSGDQMV